MRVLAVGELNPDLILSGLDGALVMGNETLAQSFSMELGSSTAIFASQIRRLGAEVVLVARIGNDFFGSFCEAKLKEVGVKTDYLLRDGSQKTGLTLSLSYPEDRILVTHLGCIQELTAEDVPLDLFSQYEHLHVSSLFLQEKLQKGVKRLFQYAKKQGLTTSLDTGDDPKGVFSLVPDLLSFVDYFLPNESELLKITRKRDYREALKSLTPYGNTIAVKRGALGSALQRKGEFLEVGGYLVTPVDTTGAGDSFNAGFLAQILKGSTLEDALRFGNACGALCAGHIGGAQGFMEAHEVFAFMERSR